MSDLMPKVEMVEVTDPKEIAEALERDQQFRRNLDWVDANASEVYSHRGKFICIAGQELFVGDSVEDVLTRAMAAHPKDYGRFTRYIPKERGPRIYAHRWGMANL